MKVIVSVIVAVLTVIGIGIGVEGGIAAGFLIPTGTQTATLLIDKSNSQRPTYSGEIAGEPLTGSLVPVPRSMNKNDACPGFPIPNVPTRPTPYLFAYSGSFDGQQYTFAGCLAISRIGPSAHPTSAMFGFTIHGEVGQLLLSGGTTFPRSTSSLFCQHATTFTPDVIKRCATLPFSGVIGTETITGFVAAHPQRNGNILLVATLTAG